MGNWIDDEEGEIEYRVGTLYGRAILKYMHHTVEVLGAENLQDLNEYHCVASNHASYLDWAMLFGYYPGSLRFIAKKELTHMPVIGSHLARRGVLIDRKGKRSAIDAIENAIKDDDQVPILIFPEGTRSNDGVPKRFKKGGLGLFAKNGVTVVPITVTGTFAYFPREAMAFNTGGHFKLIIGKPIRRRSFGSDDEMIAEVERVVHSTFAAESSSESAPSVSCDQQPSSLVT
jgi:1-acyl-sn-glycerol-3-phosphate acyltransferase